MPLHSEDPLYPHSEDDDVSLALASYGGESGPTSVGTASVSGGGNLSASLLSSSESESNNRLGAHIGTQLHPISGFSGVMSSRMKAGEVVVRQTPSGLRWSLGKGIGRGAFGEVGIKATFSVALKCCTPNWIN